MRQQIVRIGGAPPLLSTTACTFGGGSNAVARPHHRHTGLNVIDLNGVMDDTTEV